MPSILHISDLHRTGEPRLGNDALVGALVNDAEQRWKKDGIPKPDLLVVSGDLIQGANIGAFNPDCKIETQYKEAEDLLLRLAKEFVDADRARVVLVPGNHDVHWNRAQEAMEPIKCPSEIEDQAFNAEFDVRWNWRNQKAYKVKDRVRYQSRFEHFLQFQTNFYHGLDPSPLQMPNNGLFFQEYSSLGLVVVGFASWYGNDCFCRRGEIDSEFLELSRELLKKCKAPVVVAVWHHNVVGGPNVHDYMDQHTVHKLIDIGFRVGLHGHQHYPDAKPFELGLPNLASMAVISAGSIAAGVGDRPRGESRQFNIVDIDPDSESITVYFRTMLPGGIFCASYRPECRGKIFAKLKLPPMAPRPTATNAKEPDDMNKPDETKKLVDITTAVATGKYAVALDLVDDIDDLYARQKRQIKIKSLQGLERWEDLILLLNPARSAEEAVQVISLLMKFCRFDEAIGRLEAASSLLDRATYTKLAEEIAARKEIGS